MNKHNLIRHDVRFPFPLTDESVDVVVTSPPYWGLRDYGHEAITIWGGLGGCQHKWGEEIIKKERGSVGEGAQVAAHKNEYQGRETQHGAYCASCGAWRGQLGLEPHPQQYIEHLVGVFREVKRVLKPTGSFYLNLGDSYFGSWGNSYRNEDRPVEERQRPKNTDVFVRGGGDSFRPPTSYKGDGAWLQPKQLLMIPERVAVALQDDGWILRNKLVWVKPNHMPSSVKDRRVSSWENVFHFVRQGKYQFDLDAIREPHKHTGGGLGFGAKELEQNRSYEQREHPNGKNPGDVLEVTTVGSPEAHYAVFPEELVRRLLLPHAVKGVVVLDPFGGRGTTGKVAKSLGMEYVLFDISQQNIEIMERYINRSDLPNYRKHERRRNNKPLKTITDYATIKGESATDA